MKRAALVFAALLVVVLSFVVLSTGGVLALGATTGVAWLAFLAGAVVAASSSRQDGYAAGFARAARELPRAPARVRSRAVARERNRARRRRQGRGATS